MWTVARHRVRRATFLIDGKLRIVAAVLARRLRSSAPAVVSARLRLGRSEARDREARAESRRPRRHRDSVLGRRSSPDILATQFLHDLRHVFEWPTIRTRPPRFSSSARLAAEADSAWQYD